MNCAYLPICFEPVAVVLIIDGEPVSEFCKAHGEGMKTWCEKTWPKTGWEIKPYER